MLRPWPSGTTLGEDGDACTNDSVMHACRLIRVRQTWSHRLHLHKIAMAADESTVPDACAESIHIECFHQGGFRAESLSCVAGSPPRSGVHHQEALSYSSLCQL